MDTNRLKKFAVEARNKLKAGIAAKITTLGFDRNGNVPEHLHPQLMQGGSLWNGQLQTEGFYHQWQSLYSRVQAKGIKEVYEEAAYTWFNRLVAIRILQKNGLIEPVLAYVDAARTPRIVDEARMGRMPQMQERQRQLLMELLEDDSKTTEQFAILVTAFCHENPILFRCFGAMSDFTELLLPNDILTEGGFIDLLNHTEFISDADFQSPELIGWLYQFYISERKDEVFAKKGKFEADEIPAATQIFTPNWIVKYMVQNTIGRIYLDNNPSAASEFKPKWKYLVEPSTPTPKESIYKFKELTELLTGDLACGSGHILNECFDLLYDLYIYEGYSRREAIENIFKSNLRGVDLDTRAKQLATFALMLKACQKDASFADAHILPHIMTIPVPVQKEQVSECLSEFFQETPSKQIHKDLTAAFELMQDADSLGSIMKFDLAESTLLSIRQTLEYWHSQSIVPEIVEKIIPAMDLMLTLTDQYAALVMNPPYMGRSGMNDVLTDYVRKYYTAGKWDLFASFMLLAMNRLSANGKTGMINMHSWMFLDAFENLRKQILSDYHLDNMLHLGPNTFDELSGEVVQNTTFVISKSKEGSLSTYYRLSEGKNCSEKEILFKEGSNIFKGVNQEDFELIPGYPIAYWLSKKWFDLFKKDSIGDVVISKAGVVSGDDNLFVKLWYEVSLRDISFDAKEDYYKYHTFQKGGSNRFYYGNNEYVFRLKDFWDPSFYNKSMRRGDVDSYFKKGIGWSYTGSTANKAFRIIDNCVCGTATPSVYAKDSDDLYYILGFLNTNITAYLLPILNPTLSLPPGYVVRLPYIKDIDKREQITTLSKENVHISKQDWDMHETSWDFEANPIVVLRNETVSKGGMESTFCVKDFLEQFEAIWEQRFNKLHENEMELNQLFINIYGLQGELWPDVSCEDLTILQDDEIKLIPSPGSSNSPDTIEWNEDVLMKQLISYAVGVWMGRYKLGTKGLHIAHPNPSSQELQEYWYGGEQVYIDEDGLIPVLPQNSPFDDNLSSRISDFIRIVFGEEKLTDNLNFIEQKLGTSIEQYVQKDFWKDHKKMYQNRPIYWLFSSSKGAFKCLAYMHRMDAYTAERVRSNYLLPYIEFLQNQIGELENRAATLSTAENRKLQNLQKALDECREYHERLQVVAEQAIAFDLDDGVVVNYAKFGDILAKIK